MEIMEDKNLTLDEAHALAMRCLLANGCDEENAKPVADSMIAAERDICLSHGLFRLTGYIAGLRSGKVNGRARPVAETMSPSVIKVHGDGAMAPVAHVSGLGPLADLAHSSGIAALAITKCFHLSALWVEVEALTDQNLCAFACTSALPVMAPAGGTKRLFGTDPIAFGWPRSAGGAVIFDQATAAVARGEILIAEREGHQLPPGIGLDAQGAPTTDPAKVLAGAQLAFGGYKGSVLALMVELLAGPLLGETLSFETAEADNQDGGPANGGQLILAWDPERFGGGGDWDRRAERLFQRIEEMEGARLPSARRYENRQRTAREGINVAGALYEKITKLAGGPD